MEEGGLWGQGLSRVVSLSFDDPVPAIVGGLDGRSAHLIQQVITRARIPFVTPWASDFTLSRGMIPWFFQTVPDDRQQARAIVEHARGMGSKRILVLADATYDSRHLEQAVREAAETSGMPADVFRVEASGTGPDLERRVLPGMAVVIAAGQPEATGLLDRLGRLPSPPEVYAPARLAVGSFLDGPDPYPAPVLVPVPEGTDPDGLRAGRTDLPTELADDAVRAIVKAIRTAGLDPWKVRDALAVQTLDGATGLVSFSETGRREGGVRVLPASSTAGAPER